MTWRFVGRVLAGAIEAAVNAAGPTIPGKRLSKMLPRPVESHGEIIPGYAERRRDFVRFPSLQINLFHQLAILLWHQGQKTPKTVAELLLILVGGRFWKLIFKALQSAALRPLLPVNIDYRPSKNSVKPPGRFLVRVGLPVGGQGLNQALLHDIFGQVVVAQPLSGKSHENLEILENSIFNARHDRESSFRAPARKFLSASISEPSRHRWSKIRRRRSARAPLKGFQGKGLKGRSRIQAIISGFAAFKRVSKRSATPFHGAVASSMNALKSDRAPGQQWEMGGCNRSESSRGSGRRRSKTAAGSPLYTLPPG
jgi:hypothetical protein